MMGEREPALRPVSIGGRSMSSPARALHAGTKTRPARDERPDIL